MVQLGLGFERLAFLTLAFLMVTHIVACLWVFFASFADDYENTWMEGGLSDMSTGNQYLVSFYWTVTTITTVGYGDISIKTNGEKVCCIFLMIFGVVSFGLLSGSLTNILQNYDVSNAKFQEKVVTLNNIYKDYALPLDLYHRLKASIRYNYSKNHDDENEFIAELPKNLANELSLFIHEELYSKIKFLKSNAFPSFLSWICPLFKPSIFDK